MTSSSEEGTAVLIFAKYPIRGYVKSRLVTDILSEKDTLELYSAFLLDTIIQATMSNADTIILSLAHQHNPATDRLDRLSFFQRPVVSNNSKMADEFHLQEKGSFGERMAGAIEYCWQQGCERLIVLGADAPQIQPQRLNTVFHSLEHTDAVLGPSPAGGFYLIGLTRSLKLDNFADNFSGVELTKVARFIIDQGLDFELIGELTDVDNEEDLVSLIAWITTATLSQTQTIQIPKHTEKVIQELGLEVQTEMDDNRQKRIRKKGNGQFYNY